MTAKRARPAKAKRKRRAGPAVPAGAQDLDAVSRAVFGVEDERRPKAGESVEDPLQDWPESSGEPDRWVTERRKGRETPEH